MPRVAFVHDWLTVFAGAERVLKSMLDCFPEADVFTLVNFLSDDDAAFLEGRRVESSFIQSLPFARARYRTYLPLMPLAIEQFELSGYDLVISSSHAVAKGVLTGPDQLHVSYVHSPIRYAWDMQHQYLRESGLDKGVKGWIAKWLLHKIRLWDVRTANGVDQFVANSEFIARRIWKTYRREATVVYPPVDVEVFAFRANKEDFYLTASRLVPYKRVNLIVEAFAQMPDKRLMVVGNGPDREKIEHITSGHSNIELLGYQPTDALVDYMGRAKAFVFAAEEDFGIAPVEAQACGTPVIAYGRGGTRETIIPLPDAGFSESSPAPTGVFFHEQSVAAIVGAVERFEAEASVITPEACRENALRFAPERFRAEFTAFVEREWSNFQRSL